tara:strand:+ start:1434 stop:3191 length:1758 start_codon:yes stop_codon:yes gene_type:complete
MKKFAHKTEITNILVIGCGGAGLRAAIEIKSSGLDVKILGKRPKNDAHTVLAAGGINAAFGNIDTKDSWEHHFVDTYKEGYCIGDPSQIETMAKEAPSNVEEIDNWGANFAKLKNGKIDQRFFGAHKYRRTCYSGDYTGFSILNTLLKKAENLNIPIFDHKYVTELLVDNKVCFGAMAFDMNSGERTLYLADAVILCTGGHTRLWKKSSSRRNENTGDGYHLALKAGCKLIDMEMVQFHPSGMVLPEEIAGTLVTEAVRGEGGILLNNKGERFMINYDKERMELSTRDKVAMANYTEITQGRGTPNGAVYLDISHKDKEFILKKIPNIYRQFIDLQMIDISKEPMEIAPTAHYSMGGISVNAYDHSTCIKGLFAAGEVAGGLHGANRLGGNSLAEILVFGKRAGEASANYSKNLKIHCRCKSTIKKAHENINKFLKKGNNLAKPLQNNLRNIMWKYCGVVKNDELLCIGLNKVREIKNQLAEIDVRVDEYNFSDLILALDLESSIISSEATILSAINRKESRGAHQRNDFPNMDPKQNYNISIKLDQEDNSLYLERKYPNELRKDLKNLISNTKHEDDIRNKLLE